MPAYWEKITDPKSAKNASMHGVSSAILVAVLTATMAIVSISLHRPVLGIDGYGLADALLFAIVAWRIYRVSRPWAVVGLALYLIKIGLKLEQGDFSSSGLIVTFFVIVGFVNGVRGVFKLHEYRRSGVSERIETASAV